MADGEVVIEVRLEDSRFSKEYSKLEKATEKVKKLKIEVSEEGEFQFKIDKYERELDKLETKEAELLAQRRHMETFKVGDIFAVPGFEEKYIKIGEEMYDIDLKMNDILDKQYLEKQNLEEKKRLLELARNEQERANISLQEAIDKSNQNKGIISKVFNTKGASRELNMVKSGIDGVMKKVKQWGMAVFGVRSAYMAIRKAISVLSQYNKQLSVDIEYITFALARILEPVVNRVIGAVYTLLQYIAYIAKAWFNLSLFARSSVKDFMSAKKGAEGIASGIGGAVSNAKKLRKELQLLPFDEMNILQEQQDTSSGGGGAGGGVDTDLLPSFDLSKFENIKIPEWLQWIAKNKDLVTGGLATIGAIIGGWKLYQWGKALGFWGKKAIEATAGASGLKGAAAGASAGWVSLSNVLGLAAFAVPAIYGVNTLIEMLKELITTGDFASYHLGEVSQSMGGMMTVLGVAMGNPIAAIIGGLAIMGGTMYKVTDESHYLAQGVEKLKEAEDNLSLATVEVTRTQNEKKLALEDVKNKKVEAEKAQRLLEQAEKDGKISAEELIKKMSEENLSYTDLNPKQKAIFDNYEKNRKAQGELTASGERLKTAIINESKAKRTSEEATKDHTYASFQNRAMLTKEGDSYDDLGKDIELAWRKGEIRTEDARKLMELAMRNMSKEAKDSWGKNIPDEINKGIDPDRFSGRLNKLKATFKATWDKIKGWFSEPLGNFTAGGGEGYGGGSGGSRNRKGAIYLPKLATGGIINYPNHGVTLGRAIGGESGAEGVIPLTDSQMMARLGEAIGRYIVVNANITTSLNGRTINRELRRIQNEENFALNGGL